MLIGLALIIGLLFGLALHIGLKKRQETEIGGIIKQSTSAHLETQWVNGIGALKACNKMYQNNHEQIEKIFDEVAELEEANKYFDLNCLNPMGRAHTCEECLDIIVACKTYLECNFNRGEISCMIEFVNNKNKQRNYY